jgi:hypothetical protein
MTDTSQGDGWWLASDGKWYPPESASHVAAKASPSAESPPVSSGTRVMIGASALVALGSLLPWATATEPFGTISKAGTSGDGVLTLILAAGAIVCGINCYRGQPDRRKVAVAATILLVISAAISLYDMSTLPISSSHLVVVSIGIGLWFCAIGSIVGIVAGISVIQTCTRNRTNKAVANFNRDGQ